MAPRIVITIVGDDSDDMIEVVRTLPKIGSDLNRQVHHLGERAVEAFSLTHPQPEPF